MTCFLLMSFSEEFVLSIFVTFGWLKVVEILFELAYPGYTWLEDALSVQDNCVLSRGFVLLLCLDMLLSLVFVCKNAWKIENYRLSEENN